MAFAAMLKQLREEKRLSQKDIADYLGITRQAVASYELAKREPDYEVLKKLADYFDVSIDYLLGRTNCRDATAAIIGKNIDLIMLFILRHFFGQTSLQYPHCMQRSRFMLHRDSGFSTLMAPVGQRLAHKPQNIQSCMLISILPLEAGKGSFFSSGYRTVYGP